jgi:hypothetical protein
MSEKMTTGLPELIRNVSSTSLSSSSGYSCAYLNGSKTPFTINPKYIGAFLEGYCNLVQDDIESDDGEKDGSVLNLGEYVANRETLPIRAAFNLKFDRHDANAIPELYTEDFLMSLASCYQHIISKLLTISPKLSELYCFVQESTPTIKGDNIICQIILLFPFCQTSVTWQKKIFQAEVEQLLRRENIISKLTFQPIGDWKEIIEPLSTIVPLYRSVDDVSKKHPYLKHIYPYISQEMLEEGNIVESRLEDVFTPTAHSFFYKGICQPDFIEKNPEPEHWLPLLFSGWFYQGVTLPKDVGISRSSSVRPDMGSSEVYNDIEFADPKTLDGQKIITMHLLPMLSEERANERCYWLDVGRVLYNVFNGSEEGLAEYINFSSRATKHVEDRDKTDCTDVYYGFEGSFLSAKTIAFYARADSPDAYNSWHRAWCEQSMSDTLGCVTLKIAMAVYRNFWLEHYHLAGNKWYYFNNHRLILTNDAVNLRTDITRKFIPLYEKKLAEISAKVYSDYQGDESKKREAMTAINLITTLIKKLGGTQLTPVVNMCKDLFNPSQDPIRIDDISSIMDSAPGKMGLKNGVIECDDEDAFVRPGKPEDFISKTTGRPYRYDYSMDHKDVKEMLHWLRQLFPDQELFMYFIKDAASMLYGSNAEKLLRIWYGDTDAGKSALEKAYEQALGQYCVSLPVEKLTGKSGGFGGGGPNPEIAQLKGAHLVFASEAEDGQEGKSSTVKRLTGNDRIFARMCNENGGAFEAMYKIVMTTNVIPEFKNADSALKGRFLNLMFITRFVEPKDAPRTEAEQFRKRLFPKDKFFDQKIPRLSLPLLWLMKEYYHLYKTEGLIPPQVIKNGVLRYWEEHDFYLNFISEHLVQAYIEVPFSSTATIIPSSVTILPTLTTFSPTTTPILSVTSQSTLSTSSSTFSSSSASSAAVISTKATPQLESSLTTSQPESSKISLGTSRTLSLSTPNPISTSASISSSASSSQSAIYDVIATSTQPSFSSSSATSDHPSTIRIINAKAILTQRQMYPVFRTFCTNGGIQSHEIPTMTFMVTQLSDRTRLGRPYMVGKWQGIALKEQVTTI